MDTELTLLEKINLKLCCIYDKIILILNKKDPEQLSRTVWNDGGTGVELVQIIKLEDGVIIDTIYTNVDGSLFVGTVTDPTAIKPVDDEHISRTVWNDNGNGDELIQYINIVDGVITGTSYLTPSGGAYGSPIVNPTAIKPFDDEFLSRTVWNDAGTGVELIQHIRFVGGVSTTIGYLTTAGAVYGGAITNPTTIRNQPATLLMESGTQAIAPSGIWSSWVVYSEDDLLVVDGIPVKADAYMTSSANNGDKIPSPVFTGSGNYKWKGYR